MRRKILIPSSMHTDKPTLYPISWGKAKQAAGFTTDGLQDALNSLNLALMRTENQEALIHLWTNDDRHTAEALENPITILTSTTPTIGSEEDERWHEQEVLFAVLESMGNNALGFYIRGGAQAPFHLSQVVVRRLAPSQSAEAIKLLWPDGECPVSDHGWLAFMAWRIAMCLTMDDQEGVAQFVNVKCGTDVRFSVFVDHTYRMDPQVITLHTFGASGDSSEMTLNNAIWREADNPLSDEDIGVVATVEEREPEALPPIYKDKRTTLHIDFGGDFWVQQTRCPKCAQRLIIHAPASLCPSGQPVGLTVKCASCKTSFGWP